MARGYKYSMEQLVLVLGLTVLAVALFKYCKIPSIVAYLLIGVLMGPYALGVLDNSEQIRWLAEFGVVFLLFTIGLELPLEKFVAMRYNLLFIGGSQVLLCTILIASFIYFFTKSFIISWAIASALSLSSTAIIMRQLSEQNELFEKHGQLAFAMLIFQDIAVVPLLILLPLLAKFQQMGVSSGFEFVWPVVSILFKGIVVFVIIIALARTVLRKVFHKIAQIRSLELFMFMVLFVALLSAYVTHEFDLSMTFGAFVAGIGLGESEFRHQIDAEVRPFRDILLGIFFISIGMMLNLNIVIQNFVYVLFAVLSIVLIKFIIVAILCYFFGRNVNLFTAIKTAMIMAHAGEFSLALLTLAGTYGIVGGTTAQIILASAIISLFIAVLFTKYADSILKTFFGDTFQDTQPPKNYSDVSEYIAEKMQHDLDEHIIICGFGRVGKTLAKFLKKYNKPYICLELDAKLVKNGALADFNVYYGDANHKDVLASININRAKLVAVCVDNDDIAKKIISNIRMLNHEIPILVRTRDLYDRNILIELGATEVIAETFEASMMLALHMFLMSGVTPEQALEMISNVSADRDNFFTKLLAYTHKNI